MKSQRLAHLAPLVDRGADYSPRTTRMVAAVGLRARRCLIQAIDEEWHRRLVLALMGDGPPTTVLNVPRSIPGQCPVSPWSERRPTLDPDGWGHRLADGTPLDGDRAPVGQRDHRPFDGAPMVAPSRPRPNDRRLRRCTSEIIAQKRSVSTRGRSSAVVCPPVVPPRRFG
jgi:hypothetical protein